MFTAETHEVYYCGMVYPIEKIETAWFGLYVSYGGTKSVFDETTGIHSDDETCDNPARLRTKSTSAVIEKFQVLRGRSEWAKDDWYEVSEHFNIADAKTACADFKSGDTEYRYMIKRVSQNNAIGDYSKWAVERFNSGDWVPVPWADEPWADRVPSYHYPHISKADPSYVAYWATEIDAQKDRVSTKRAGSYLNEFANGAVKDHEIEKLVHRMDPPGNLILSGKDPEDIYEAYAFRTESCMKYRDDSDKWNIGESPVRVYGGGDLEVASLVRRGSIVAQCLVWPEKKIAGRRYGDIGRLENALLAEGYILDSDEGENDMHTVGYGGFEGARLLRVEPDDYPGNLIMPYVDFQYRVAVREDHCILTRKDDGYLAHRTDGLLLDTDETLSGSLPYSACARCGSEDSEDDFRLVGDEMWCTACVANHSEWCDPGSHRVTTDNAVETRHGSYCHEHADVAPVCHHCHTRVGYVLEAHLPGSHILVPVCNSCYGSSVRYIDGRYEYIAAPVEEAA